MNAAIGPIYFHKHLTNTELKRLIEIGVITLGGNKILKIYGLLSCRSGKRMKRENRVFFETIRDAEEYGYRPCGSCLNRAYKRWKKDETSI